MNIISENSTMDGSFVQSFICIYSFDPGHDPQSMDPYQLFAHISNLVI